MSKSLEYLDLELRQAKKKVSLDNISYYCFCERQGVQHRFHTSEEPQLNLLCDTSFSILQNLLVLSKLHTKLHEDLVKNIQIISQHLTDINVKLEYIKHQKQTLPSSSQTALTRLEVIEKSLKELTLLIKKNIGNE